MAIYEYVGIDKKGKSVKGLKEADSTKSLRIALRTSGIFVTKIKEARVGRGLAPLKIGFKTEVIFNNLV